MEQHFHLTARIHWETATANKSLNIQSPKRGRRRTPESIARRLAVINTESKTADAVTKVRLIQERLNLRRELSGMKSKPEIASAETQFVKVARSFSERNDISYDAWREFGVTPPVLKKAGINKD